MGFMKNDQQQESFEKKETTIKLNEPFRISVKSFAKGHKVEFTINMNPDNSIHMDRLTKELASSEIKQAIKATHEIITTPIEKGGLGSIVLEND